MAEQIKKYTFKSGIKPEVEIIPLETLLKANKALLAHPHRTDFYHIFLFENCSLSHLVDFAPVKITPYTLLFLNKEMVHQFDKPFKYKGLLLIFTDDFFCLSERDAKFLRGATLFNDISGKPDVCPGTAVFKNLVNIYKAIQEELGLPADQIKHDLLKNLVHNVLLLAEREKRKQGFNESKRGIELSYTLMFRELLEKDFRSSKKVYEYAAKLNISEKVLGQSTLKVLGKSAKELINERVLLEAKRLLIHASISVKEIGFQLGFDEPTNFVKYFHKHTGDTPLEFREKNISGLFS